MISFPPHPVPVATTLGNGYVWYIKQNGMLENDEVAVVLNDGGEVKHFLTSQIKIWHNETYGIKKK